MTPKLNWVSRFTQFFLNRRQLVLVVGFLLLIGGIASLAGLRREGFPQVPVKIVLVTTIYRGASAAEVEQSITNPVEAAVKDLKITKSLQSRSADNVSIITITLDEKAGADAALQDISSKISGISLPKDAEKPEVTQPTTGNSAFIFGLTGPTNEAKLLDQGRVFEREVSGVAGIKQVTLQSQYQPKVRLTVDPAKVAANNVDISNLATTLSSNNLNFPLGELTLDQQRATVLLSGRITTLDQLASTPIPTRTGRTVRLSDIATIEQIIDQDGRINRVGNQTDGLIKSHPGIVYGVDIRSDADILNVNHTLTDKLKQLQDNGTLSSDLQVVRLYDDAASTQHQIDEIKAGAIGEKWRDIGPLGYVGYLVGGIWLLMLAMFLFVNLRTALIAGIAIPLSFFFALIALYLSGITLNTLTLFSMILILGLVVDPAIVVLEQMQRYRDMGRNGREGILAAMNSIGPGLILATLCSIIVFTPFGVVSGVFGEIIKFIPITVIPALIGSFFVPLLFLVPLADRFMKARKELAGSAHSEEAALWSVSRWFKHANLFILKRAWLQVVIILLAITVPIGLTGYIFATGKVKSAQFSKPHDTIEAQVTVSHPAKLTTPQIMELARTTEAALAKHNQIRNYFYISQNASGFSLWLNLTPTDDRLITSEDLVKEIERDLPDQPDREIYYDAATISYGPPDNNFPVQVQISDNDLGKLKTFALALAGEARRQDGVARVSDGYADKATNETAITINKTAAEQRGLSVAAVGAQLAGLLGEQRLTKAQFGNQELDVVMRFTGNDSYTTIDALKKIVVQSPTGPVTLSQIADFGSSSGTGVINHQDGNRYALVRAAVKDDANYIKIQQNLNAWAKDHLDDYQLHADALESKGEGDDIAKSFGELFMALGLAVLLVYLVLAVFFNSFLKPFIITLALPLSFVGVFPTLWALDQQFGFLEILGLITLAGIVVNVGIFVIDYANRRVAEGLDPKEAVALATAVRFRPIFLTKVVALGSLLPLALLSPFWRGLSSVIIAGILTSGILSLFTTPILYVWFTKLGHLPSWTKRKVSGLRKRPNTA